MDKRERISYAPVVIEGRWYFARTEGDVVMKVRDCRTCEGHGLPERATEHYVLGFDEPSTDKTGREVQQ